MRHYQTIKIRPSKYLRSFQYESDQFIYHSCLGNPIKVNDAWLEFLELVESGVTLRELVSHPALVLNVKLLLEKKLLEYENSKDLLEENLSANDKKISSGELIKLLVLDLHTACNMGCSYCYAAKTQEKHGLKGKAMSFETAKQAIDEFVFLTKKNRKRTAAISYFGGEPLLNYSVLASALEYVSSINARERSVHLTQAVTTNGSLISKQHIEDFKKNGCFVAISIDGLREEHNKFRIYKSGDGTFDRVERSLKLLIENGISLEVIVTVGTHNSTGLQAFIDHLYVLGVRRISIKGQTYTRLNDADRLKISGAVMAGLGYAAEKGMLAKKGPGELDYSRGCQGLGGLVCVEPSGDIYPCPEGSRIKLGTVSEFSQIPSSAGYRTISSRITGNLKQCRGCDVEGLCKGGCAGESEYRFDDVYKIDPNECNNIRQTIKRNLALYGRN